MGLSAYILYFFGGIKMLERDFQAKLIKELKARFPGCVVLKNDANYIQGIPDLTVFYQNTWAMLEVKKDSSSKHQANQEVWVDKANNMSFARFIFPENKEEVLNELERLFQPERAACVSEPQ